MGYSEANNDSRAVKLALGTGRRGGTGHKQSRSRRTKSQVPCEQLGIRTSAKEDKAQGKASRVVQNPKLHRNGRRVQGAGGLVIPTCVYQEGKDHDCLPQSHILRDYHSGAGTSTGTRRRLTEARGNERG